MLYFFISVRSIYVRENVFLRAIIDFLDSRNKVRLSFEVKKESPDSVPVAAIKSGKTGSSIYSFFLSSVHIFKQNKLAFNDIMIKNVWYCRNAMVSNKTIFPSSILYTSVPIMYV